MDVSTADARRSSIEKTPITPPPFDRLPDEIIEQILTETDPNGFASLVLLNRKWRAVSQRSYLYRLHLAQCPSYAASHATLPSATENDLPRLRRLFAREVKRNLFEAYRRPSETVIELVSNSISSSSCPGGEGMQFNTSPKGHHILAYNSSRIYVIDVRSPNLEVKRELKILRRPISACIMDDGSLLAILSTEMQVDLYDLKQSPPRRTQSTILDNTPRTIALSPCGSVLAAAYEGGIEVSSMKSDALPTDRRAVKCDAVDTLAFSFDGTQILGTTTHSSSPATVILTAPYYDPGSHLPHDNMSPLWTTSILFPNTSRDCSHAVLLQDGHEEEAAWTFTYDRSFETFRAVRIDDLRNGTTYFTGPVPNADSQARLLPCTLPAANYRGELVSAGFQGKEVWVYGVPEDLDAVPDVATSSAEGNSSSGLGRENSGRSGSSRRPSTRAQDAHAGRVPKWQLLCDKLRNTFITGCKVSELAGLSHAKWVSGFGSSSAQERLVVAARGVTPGRLVTDEEDIDFIDGGRLTLLDFDYGSSNGTRTEITIEVGTDNAEVLEEEQRDIATEVAIVRRRTVAQRRGGRTGMLRAATTAGQAPAMCAAPSLPQHGDTDDDPLVPRRMGQVSAGHSGDTGHAMEAEEEADGVSMEEMEALDAPYAHASPRSGTTLRRAATAAAVNRTLHPRTADGRRIEYRRADGRAEHPHESDADNWVPPPPPYQKEQDPQDLPAFLRGTAIAPLPPAIPPLPPMPPSFAASSTQRPPSDGARGPHLIPGVQSPRSPAQRSVSDSAAMSRPQARENPRPSSSPSNYEGELSDVEPDNLYDVTPSGSPDPTRVSLESPRSPHEYRRVSALSVLPPEVPRPFTAPLNTVALVSPPSSQSGSVGEFNDRPQAVTLDSHRPYNTGSIAQSSSIPAPRLRSLSNAQTWPAGLSPDTDQPTNVATTDTWSAPTSQILQNELASSLPPLPSTNQLASLNKRISQGNPHRLSGGFQVPRRPVGSSDGHSSSRASSSLQQPLNRRSEPEFDQPLIISTPKGVSGAFDPPSRQTSSRRNETPLLAPIPRHPRPTHTSSTRPTVERLETIYSVASDPGHHAPLQHPSREQPSMFPAWLRPPPIPSTRTSPGVNRRPSRAERSAAKNIQDAKKRGWKAKTKSSSNKKKKKKNTDAASSAGWTDVSFGFDHDHDKSEKDKKCIVM